MKLECIVLVLAKHSNSKPDRDEVQARVGYLRSTNSIRRCKYVPNKIGVDASFLVAENLKQEPNNPNRPDCSERARLGKLITKSELALGFAMSHHGHSKLINKFLHQHRTQIETYLRLVRFY